MAYAKLLQEMLNLPVGTEAGAKGKLADEVERLPEQYREIVRRHYGLDDRKPESFAKIAADPSLFARGKKVSAQRVQQINARALRQLRHPSLWQKKE